MRGSWKESGRILKGSWKIDSWIWDFGFGRAGGFVSWERFCGDFDRISQGFWKQGLGVDFDRIRIADLGRVWKDVGRTCGDAGWLGNLGFRISEL